MTLRFRVGSCMLDLLSQQIYSEIKGLVHLLILLFALTKARSFSVSTQQTVSQASVNVYHSQAFSIVLGCYHDRSRKSVHSSPCDRVFNPPLGGHAGRMMYKLGIVRMVAYVEQIE